MKNGRYFNFRDICDRNLWDTGYLVKKLQGYGILRPPLMGPPYYLVRTSVRGFSAYPATINVNNKYVNAVGLSII